MLVYTHVLAMIVTLHPNKHCIQTRLSCEELILTSAKMDGGIVDYTEFLMSKAEF